MFENVETGVQMLDAAITPQQKTNLAILCWSAAAFFAVLGTGVYVTRNS